MIVKTISIKSKQGVRNAIRYILKHHKLEPPKKERDDKRLYVPGIHLTALDLKHLYSEKIDNEIMNQLRQFKGSMQEFIKTELMGRLPASKEAVSGKTAFTHNILLKSKELSATEIAKAYEENEKYRQHARANMNYATHTIISFHALDSTHLTNAALVDIAKQYISLRGSTGIFTAAIHANRDHRHVHLIESSIAFRTGQSLRIDKDKYKNIKVSLQLYTEKRYPALTHSSVRHDKTKDLDKAPKNLYKNAERTYLREQINTSVTAIAEKSTSMADFKARVGEVGYSVYSRGGRVTGIQCNDTGLKMRFSRMGILERVNELDLKNERIEKALKEMKNLRSRGNEISKDKREADKQSNHKVPDDLQHDLNALQAQDEDRHQEEDRGQAFERDITDSSDQKDNNEDEETEWSHYPVDEDESTEPSVNNDTDDFE